MVFINLSVLQVHACMKTCLLLVVSFICNDITLFCKYVPVRQYA